MLIFGLGGGVSICEGVQHVVHPAPQTNVPVNYVVLGLAIVFEGAAWGVVLREFRKVKGPLGYLQAVRRSKDPATFTVLFEDTAALAGLVVALVGTTLGHLFHIPELDGAAPVMIGLIHCAVAAFLAFEAKGPLVGEGVVEVVQNRKRMRPVPS